MGSIIIWGIILTTYVCSLFTVTDFMATLPMLIEIMQHNVAFYVLDRIIFIAIVSYAIVIPLIESESQVSITSTTSII